MFLNLPTKLCLLKIKLSTDFLFAFCAIRNVTLLLLLLLYYFYLTTPQLVLLFVHLIAQESILYLLLKLFLLFLSFLLTFAYLFAILLLVVIMLRLYLRTSVHCLVCLSQSDIPWGSPLCFHCTIEPTLCSFCYLYNILSQSLTLPPISILKELIFFGRKKDTY